MIHTALTKARAGAVAESLLRVDVVLRCEDTARTRVQVMKPLVGDMRVAQILNSCHLLPLPWQSVF